MLKAFLNDEIKASNYSGIPVPAENFVQNERIVKNFTENDAKNFRKNRLISRAFGQLKKEALMEKLLRSLDRKAYSHYEFNLKM